MSSSHSLSSKTDEYKLKTSDYSPSLKSSTGANDNIDIEKQQPIQNEEKSKSTVENQQAPEPYSAFSPNRRKFIIFVITLAGFLGPVSGNIYIPILPLLQEVFHCSQTTMNATVSVFMGVFAITPLLWASFSDLGGRKSLYIVSLVFFIVANILLAAVPANIGALFVLRVVQAFGASSVMSVGAGTVADIIEPKHRAKAISFFMLGPQMGPVLGPILSVISVNDEWRWIFGFLALLGFTVYLVILFFLPETLRYLVGNGSQSSKSWFVIPKFRQKRIVDDEKRYPRPPKPSVQGILKILKYKPVTLCSLNAGLLFATFYGVSVTFAQVLKDKYHFNSVARSFSYVCPGISLVSGSLIGGRLSDRLRRKMIEKHADKYVPEHRFSIQIFGLLVSMAGVLGYGWCVDRHVHVVAVFVFTFLTGFGMTFVFVTTTTYLTECSTRQPATNVAVGNFFRNASAAVSSVVIERLIDKETFGWCFTGLAFLDLIGIAIVLILIKKGPHWRSEFTKSFVPPSAPAAMSKIKS